MTDSRIGNDLIAELEKLPYDLQVRVLGFVKGLIPKGVQGRSLLRFEGAIAPSELKTMSRCIEENCEKVDMSEW